MENISSFSDFKKNILNHFESEIFKKDNWVEFSRRHEHAPNDAGVYCFFLNDIPIYIGESGCLKKRMKDIERTKSHTFRRALGNKHFKNYDGFIKASSKNKFPEHIEALVDNYLSNLFVSFINIDFGRTETEEYLIKKYSPEFNKKRKRKIA